MKQRLFMGLLGTTLMLVGLHSWRTELSKLQASSALQVRPAQQRHNNQIARSHKLQILIPLYIYPSHYSPKTYVWPDIAAAQAHVPITAIINPNNGPDGGPPNQDYVRGLHDLRTAGVKLLGYIATNYGQRDQAAIKAEIDLYRKYYNLDGIFLDEATSQTDKSPFYQALYAYIKRTAGLKMVVSNQGTQTDEVYFSQPTADTVVICENYAAEWTRYTSPRYALHYSPDRFAALIHSVPDSATMKQAIDQAVARNVQYVYITDDSPDRGDRNPWNTLPSYWLEEVQYIQAINQEAEAE